MGTHPIFESDFDCLTEMLSSRVLWLQAAVAKRSVTNLTKLSSQEKVLRNRFSDSEVFEPFLNYDDIFNLVDSITWQDLAKRKMQFGHHVQVRDPYMAKYILGNRSGIDIIDLDKSRMLLILALNFVGHIAIRGGTILFTTSKFNAKGYVQNAAFECGEYSVINFNPDNLIGQQKTVLPDCIFMIGANGPRPGELPPVLIWAAENNIPTCGLVDTDCNPSLISYPIPGNDDDGAVADLVLEWAAKVINEGKQIRNSVSKLYEAHSSVRLDGKESADTTIGAVEMDVVAALKETFKIREQLVEDYRAKEAERAAVQAAERAAKAQSASSQEEAKKEKLNRDSA